MLLDIEWGNRTSVGIVSSLSPFVLLAGSSPTDASLAAMDIEDLTQGLDKVVRRRVALLAGVGPAAKEINN